jgi:hypothetical protein
MVADKEDDLQFWYYFYSAYINIHCVTYWT